MLYRCWNWALNISGSSSSSISCIVYGYAYNTYNMYVYIPYIEHTVVHIVLWHRCGECLICTLPRIVVNVACKLGTLIPLLGNTDLANSGNYWQLFCWSSNRLLATFFSLLRSIWQTCKKRNGHIVFCVRVCVCVCLAKIGTHVTLHNARADSATRMRSRAFRFIIHTHKLRAPYKVFFNYIYWHAYVHITCFILYTK